MKFMLGCFIYFMVFVSYGQTKHEKIVDIIKKLKLVDTQKADFESKFEVLKRMASDDDTIRIAQLEAKISEDVITEKLIVSLAYFLEDDSIDVLYRCNHSEDCDKDIDLEGLQEAIIVEFTTINAAIEKITNSFKPYSGSYGASDAFAAVPVDREDGFYAILDYVDNARDEDVALEAVPAIVSADILKVEKIYSNYGNNKPEIVIAFTKEGTHKFALLTANNIGKPIAIVIDKQIISLPYVNSKITGGYVNISNGFSEKEINEMIRKLRGDKK
ncbi:SecDF P1 head subdomain-containing protein [Psychroserpens sp. NJDZ02]|uniref:SecDF P1 head subdomain-containing protein n=1 Tax=Psychroserpens sp. NJDZ02 TaxID=2570561 RepID=UPI0010A8FEA6|nr:hypothetical protein [Psychroserpens sp. NJDZ02]QCE43363.1 hypothetical protein E9099_18705 [Psychroserpens sp. NJDZ02]